MMSVHHRSTMLSECEIHASEQPLRPGHLGACVRVYTSECMHRSTYSRAHASGRIHSDPHHRHNVVAHRGRQGWRLRQRLLSTHRVRAPPSALWSQRRRHPSICTGIGITGPTSSGREAAGSAAGACRPSIVSASSCDRDECMCPRTCTGLILAHTACFRTEGERWAALTGAHCLKLAAFSRFTRYSSTALSISVCLSHFCHTAPGIAIGTPIPKTAEYMSTMLLLPPSCPWLACLSIERASSGALAATS